MLSLLFLIALVAAEDGDGGKCILHIVQLCSTVSTEGSAPTVQPCALTARELLDLKLWRCCKRSHRKVCCLHWVKQESIVQSLKYFVILFCFVRWHAFLKKWKMSQCYWRYSFFILWYSNYRAQLCVCRSVRSTSGHVLVCLGGVVSCVCFYLTTALQYFPSLSCRSSAEALLPKCSL